MNMEVVIHCERKIEADLSDECLDMEMSFFLQLFNVVDITFFWPDSRGLLALPR